jgi:hypothetical protein
MLRICYAEEWDTDFIRWTTNLLRPFLEQGSVGFVGQLAQPQMMLASIWRPHAFPPGIPVVLVSNESWALYKPRAPLDKYLAVMGLYPPEESCNFIAFPYAAVHFDVPVDELYRLRRELLDIPKTRFCCFVTSNIVGELAWKRIALADAINAWRGVDAAGRVCNNVNYLAPRGLDFLRWIAQYRYMICPENSKEPGYITEKPYQAWFAGTVPIYDGGCVADLNPDAFIDASSDGVIAKLAELEGSPDRYEAIRQAQLSHVPISLALFIEGFRALVLDRYQRTSNRGVPGLAL